MKHLRLFKTDASFNTAKDSFPSGVNVSYVNESNKVYALKTIKSDDQQDDDFVDLGLPSGLKWASCNLGATKPEEYGDYYMWGSTTPITNGNCLWENTPFNGGASDYDETYFASVSGTVCPNNVLAAENDAAHVIMGGNWRMPTKEECDELLENTTNEWTTENGVYGRKFTSKTDSSKYIFIPASSSYTSLWSSSLDESYPDCSWSLDFTDDDIYVCYSNRCIARCVRGVRGVKD